MKAQITHWHHVKFLNFVHHFKIQLSLEHSAQGIAYYVSQITDFLKILVYFNTPLNNEKSRVVMQFCSLSLAKNDSNNNLHVLQFLTCIPECYNY